MKHTFAVRESLGDPGNISMPFANISAVLRDMADPAFVEALRCVVVQDSALQCITMQKRNSVESLTGKFVHMLITKETLWV